MPKISVNIPCYNSSRFIRETIESVLRQTYDDFEVIVMDDGSIDRTGEIVKSFTDPRIKYFYKSNEGLSETRNKGIRASRGEYVAFLDHDDIWLADKLAKQARILDKSEDVGVVFSDSYISKDGQIQKMTYFEKANPSKGNVFEDLLLRPSNFIPLSTVMMKRAIFGVVGYFKKEFMVGEEYELFLRVADRYKFDYIAEPLAEYRVHEGNFSNRKELTAREMVNILEFWKEAKPDLYSKKKELFSRKEAVLWYEAANYYALNCRKKESIDYFNLSLESHADINVLMKKCIVGSFGCAGYRLMSSLFNRIRGSS